MLQILLPLTRPIYQRQVQRSLTSISNNIKMESNTRQLPPLPPLPINASEETIQSSHGFSSNAHWVIPNILMQGSRPGFGLETETALIDQVRTLVKDAKCTTFVSLQAECVPEDKSTLLTDGGYQKPTPKNLPGYAKHAVDAANDIQGKEEPQFLYYGIIGMQTAQSIDTLHGAILDLASRIQSQKNETIYVHCGGGVGRAGLVCAGVLGALYDTLSAEEAMAYTSGLCYLRNVGGTEGVHYSSPETEEQKEQVREIFRKLRGG